MGDTYVERVHSRMREEIEPLRERIVGIIDRCGYGELRFTMVPREDYLDLLEKYAEHIKEHRCLFLEEIYPHPDDHEDYNYNEVDFHSWSIGFFMSRGVLPTDCFSLATFLRYTMEDWEPDYRGEKES